MSKESIDIDLFDKYSHGEMDEEENADFEKRLHLDSELKEQFELYQASLVLIESQSIGEEIGSILNEENSNKTIWLSVAASLAILAIVSIFFLQDNSKNFFDDHFKPYPNVISTRSSEKSYEGFNFYNKGSHDLAENSFESVEVKSDTIYFYLAMSQLSQGNAVSAINNLNEIDELSIFYPQKIWYIGLANIKLGNVKEAISFFQQIKPKTYKYKEANAIAAHLVEQFSSSEEGRQNK